MNSEIHRAIDAAIGGGRVADAIDLLDRTLLQAPDDFTGWMKLAALRRGSGDARAALDATNAALALRPDDFIAVLLKGVLHEQLGELERAAEVYRAALLHAGKQDKLAVPIVSQLDRARSFLVRYRRGIDSRLQVTASLDRQHQMRARRFADNVLDRRPVYHQEPTHYRYPGLPDVEFFDEAYGELRERLQRAFPDILTEFEALATAHADRQRPYVDFAPGQPIGQWSALNRSTAWNALHLVRYGVPDEVNAAACPRTIAAFTGEEQAVIPGLGPNLMFSLLAAHTHIPAHHGVANFRIVCHLPVIVPTGCRFRVGAETREWRTGEPWLFDDTIEHEAWNDSDNLRVVLIGDVWRPELDEQDRDVVRDFMQAQGAVGAIGAL